MPACGLYGAREGPGERAGWRNVRPVINESCCEAGWEGGVGGHRWHRSEASVRTIWGPGWRTGLAIDAEISLTARGGGGVASWAHERLSCGSLCRKRGLSFLGAPWRTLTEGVKAGGPRLSLSLPQPPSLGSRQGCGVDDDHVGKRGQNHTTLIKIGKRGTDKTMALHATCLSHNLARVEL